MKTLIVEDEITSRVLLRELLKRFGPPHVAMNGKEAVAAVSTALLAGEPYDLICLDIMMPEMDGQAALKEIRRMERAADVAWPNRVRIVMTTALADLPSVVNAIRGKCDCFLAKPVRKAKLLEELRKLALIN